MKQNIKLFDSELKIMDALWKGGDATAGQLAKQMQSETGWNRNTTYTVIKKLIDKGAIERKEPNFICHALMTREQAQQQEARGLIDKMFDGSAALFFSAFVNGKNLSQNEIEQLKQLVEGMPEKDLESDKNQ